MSQEKIDSCYAVEDNDKALECLKNIVRAGEGACKPKLVLFTQKDCTPCQEQKAKHAQAIKEGVIQELSVNTDRGMAVAIKNELEYFPALVLLDCQDKIIYPTESG